MASLIYPVVAALTLTRAVEAVVTGQAPVTLRHTGSPCVAPLLIWCQAGFYQLVFIWERVQSAHVFDVSCCVCWLHTYYTVISAQRHQYTINTI